MCAMITTPGFKLAYLLYLRCVKLLHFLSFPPKTLPLLLCLYVFVETLVEGKKARKMEDDPSVSNERAWLKKEGCWEDLSLSSLFVLSVKTFWEEVFLLLPVVWFLFPFAGHSVETISHSCFLLKKTYMSNHITTAGNFIFKCTTCGNLP